MPINPISIAELIEKLQEVYRDGATHCTIEISEKTNKIIFHPLRWEDGNKDIELKD